MLDFSDANPHIAPIGELITDGAFVKLKMKIRPGGHNGADPMDVMLLKKSQTSDAVFLDGEFTVEGGEFNSRKLWQNLIVDGGKRDKNNVSIGWNMSKNLIRAMIDSAAKLNPDDKSDQANQQRRIQAFKQLDGITFIARVMVRPSDNEQYSDKNEIANCVFVTDPQYEAVMNGQHVAPDPINAKPKKQVAAKPDQQQTLGWQSNAATPAQAAAQQPLTPAQSPQQASAAPSWVTG
jgi:hypothetical protein